MILCCSGFESKSTCHFYQSRLHSLLCCSRSAKLLRSARESRHLNKCCPLPYSSTEKIRMELASLSLGPGIRQNPTGIVGVEVKKASLLRISGSIRIVAHRHSFLSEKMRLLRILRVKRWPKRQKDISCALCWNLIRLQLVFATITQGFFRPSLWYCIRTYQIFWSHVPVFNVIWPSLLGVNKTTGKQVSVPSRPMRSPP